MNTTNNKTSKTRDAIYIVEWNMEGYEVNSNAERKRILYRVLSVAFEK